MAESWADLGTPVKSPYPDKAQFASYADKAFGVGKWKPTSEFRTDKREGELRQQGLGTVAPGHISHHSMGTPAAPGAYDIQVPGMSPSQVAARLKSAGWRGTELPEGSHLHTNAPESWADLGQAPSAPAEPPQRDTVSAADRAPVSQERMQSRIGQPATFGQATARRAAPAWEQFKKGAREEVTPFGALPGKAHADVAGGLMGLAAAPVGGAAEALAPKMRLDQPAYRDAQGRQVYQRGLGKFTSQAPTGEEGARHSRLVGDIAEAAIPAPEIGAVREVADAARLARGEAKAVSSLKQGVARGFDSETRKLTAQEQRLHNIRVSEWKRAGGRTSDLPPGALKGGRKAAEEAARAKGGMTQAADLAAKERSLDTFQRLTYDKALEDFGGQKFPRTGEAGNAGVRFVQKAADKAFNRVLPHVKLKWDTKLENDLADVSAQMEELRGPEERRAYQALDRSVRQQLEPGVELDGRAFKRIESDLTRDIRGLRSNPERQREADVLDSYLHALRENLERHSPQQWARELRRVNRGYAKLTLIERAAARDAKAGGKFNTDDLLEATKQADISPRNRNFAAGNAHMQRWGDTAHKLLNADTAGHVGVSPHEAVPFLSPHGVLSTGVRKGTTMAADPIARASIRAKQLQAAQRDALSVRAARRAKKNPEFWTRKKSRIGDVATGVGAETAIQDRDR